MTKKKKKTAAGEPAVEEIKEEKVAVKQLPQITCDAVTVRVRLEKMYFEDGGLNVKPGDKVIADTGNGLEFGVVLKEYGSVTSDKIVLPLGKIVRFATKADEDALDGIAEKEVDAFNRCLGIIEDSALPMKLVDAEYAFDMTRLTFCFTAEDRVDFRELVKVLASTFRTRIDLRQIGIRDEAKLIGGIGPCGRSFCCRDFGPCSNQMTIRMAKDQGLSLNAGKISGACNRLMCCLRYEQEDYAEELSKMPKVNAVVGTPDGDGVVVELQPLSGKLKVILDSNQNIKTYNNEDCVPRGYTKGKRPQVQQENAAQTGEKDVKNGKTES